MTTRPKAANRVMEYLGANGMVIGWAFLAASEYRKWKRRPRSHEDVSGYFVIDGNEHMGEYGSMPCIRMLDYFHTVAQVPDRDHEVDDLRSIFEMSADHPARVLR